jgi:hypothetical protein
MFTSKDEALGVSIPSTEKKNKSGERMQNDK